jgi:CBS domain-containing protein
MPNAKSIMNVDFATITPRATLADAIEKSLATQPAGLMVVGDRNELLGVITDFALLAGVYDEKLQAEPVRDHMTTDAITVESDATLTQLADLMILHRVHQLPVVRDGVVIGVVTRRALLRAGCRATAAAH